MDRDDLESVPGSPFDGIGTPRKTYPARRRCSEPSCETILSVYNATAYCARHEGGPVGVRGRRRAS